MFYIILAEITLRVVEDVKGVRLKMKYMQAIKIIIDDV